SDRHDVAFHAADGEERRGALIDERVQTRVGHRAENREQGAVARAGANAEVARAVLAHEIEHVTRFVDVRHSFEVYAERSEASAEQSTRSPNHCAVSANCSIDPSLRSG